MAGTLVGLAQRFVLAGVNGDGAALDLPSLGPLVYLYPERVAHRFVTAPGGLAAGDVGRVRRQAPLAGQRVQQGAPVGAQGQPSAALKVQDRPGHTGWLAAGFDQKIYQGGFAVAAQAGEGQYPCPVAGPQRVKGGDSGFAVGKVAQARREFYLR